MGAVSTNTTVLEKDVKLKTDSTKIVICWEMVTIIVFLHVVALHGVYLVFTKAMWQTCLFACCLFMTSGLGVTAGVHRLWAHRSYKAKLPLRILLLAFQTLALQGSVLQWVRDHRLHHKHSDTNADPHNSTRGFFYSHIGWLMTRKNPEVLAKGKTIDISDIRNDKLLVFQNKHIYFLGPLVCYAMPMYIPTLWGEEAWTALAVAGVLRHVYSLHVAFLINSAAHMWGNKPYDRNIKPVEIKPVSFLSYGEGFHNYHHTFPWDYRAAELGGYTFNITKLFIDAMAIIGWAYDLKIVTKEMIEHRAEKTGDGTHSVYTLDERKFDKIYELIMSKVRAL